MSARERRIIRIAALRRVLAVAGNAVLSGLRHRVLALFAATSIGLLFISRGLGQFDFGDSELRFLGEFGLGAITLTGALLVPLLTAQLFFDDLGHGVLACLFSSKLRRGEYVAGVCAGVGVLAGAFVLVEGVVLGWLAHRAAPSASVGALAAVLAQGCGLIWLKLLLGSAMTLVVCAYASNAAFASCAGILLMGVAHLRGLVPAGGPASFLRLWPNLAGFDAGALWSGSALLGFNELGALGLYAAFYTAVLVVVSAWVLRRREF